VHDPDWWIKSYVEREGIDTSALVHPTIALRREADTFPESLAELTTEEQVRAVLEDFNRRVVAEWRRPLTGPSLPVVARQVAVEPMINRGRALRAESEAAEREVASHPALPDATPHTGGLWRRLAARLTRGRDTGLAPLSTAGASPASTHPGLSACHQARRRQVLADDPPAAITAWRPMPTPGRWWLRRRSTYDHLLDGGWHLYRLDDCLAHG
jgi:hypothetical protein